jgi:MGT family glycosyltransferase
LKILFATMPFDGHVNPLTGIAVHLKQQGHDVRWYAGPSYADKLSALGIHCYAFQRAAEVNGQNIAAVFPERARLKGPKLISFDSEKIFVANVGNHYSDITDIRREFPFDVLFCDGAFFAAKLVTEKMHVPVYSIGPAPMLASSRDVPPPFFGLKPPDTLRRRVLARGARVLLHSGLKQSVRTYNALLATQGLAPVPVAEWFDIPHACARRFFQVGAPGLDYPRSDLPPNVTFVGPLLPAPGRLDAALAERLRAHQSTVIAVSQGTVDNDDPGKLLIPTLDALKGRPYLVVATTGGAHTRDLRRRYPEANVVIEDFVDFGVLFEHTALFITNGGYGGVLSALSHGVPLLAAGLREGKNDINVRLEHLGFGLDLRTENPTAEQITHGVDRILRDEAISRNVARIQAELASYQALDIIDRYLAESPPPRVPPSGGAEA